MKIRIIKKFILSKILGRGLNALYTSYIYNLKQKHYKKTGTNVILCPPLFLPPERITLESNTRIQSGVRIICSPKQDVLIKEYAIISSGTIIIPGNHTSTIGVPQNLSYLGINDVNGTLVIGEDTWIGANSVLLYKAQIGRGAIVAGGATVSKEVPPYAVVGGIPAKIIAVRFTVEQILEHEKQLYKPSDRLSEEYLKELFAKHYEGLNIIGVSNITDADISKLEAERYKLKVTNYSKQ